LVLGCLGTFSTHRTELAVSNGFSKEFIIVCALGTFQWYSSLDWTVAATGAREHLEMFGATKAIVTGRAVSTSFIFIARSINQAESSWQALVLDSINAVAAFRASVMNSELTSGRTKETSRAN
jgi:hypothetical protein